MDCVAKRVDDVIVSAKLIWFAVDPSLKFQRFDKISTAPVDEESDFPVGVFELGVDGIDSVLNIRVSLRVRNAKA